MIRILSLSLLTGGLLLASCSRRSYPGDNNPYPDNRRIPDDRRYPNQGGVYSPNPGNLPPGQAKKVYGGRSARPYAHGQWKKRPRGYQPPLVVVITDRSRTRCDDRGRWYYFNDYGYRYWQQQDTRYYLDEQYARDHFRDRNDDDDDDRYDRSKREKHHGKGKGRGKSHRNRDDD